MTSRLEPSPAPQFSSPLPGDERTWAASDVGSASRWSSALRTFTRSISSFAYPTAIFWTRRLILLHNEPWTKVSDITGQGQAQRDKLAASVWHALATSLDGGLPGRILDRHFLREKTHVHGGYTVLLSPLFDESRGHDPTGVLVQLIPQQAVPSNGSTRNVESRSSVDGDAAKASALHTNTSGDGTTWDKHPFFHRFAEMLPTGLAIINNRAESVYVNNRFYELTTHEATDKTFTSWPKSIHSDDYERVMQAYQEAVRDQKELRIEFRALAEEVYWRLLLLTPVGEENLKHARALQVTPVRLGGSHGFICTIVDITSEKSAELSEREAAREAVERKKQQERFIDMISHEIRNPLSAILHCTEDIEAAIDGKSSDVDLEVIREALETIDLCISHQRKIVDDVLSFSKLDSSMLALVPNPTQPSQHVAECLKIFGPEFRRQELELKYRIDTSYVDYDMSWVMEDRNRVGQILVNLLTNAIKFTAKSEGEKAVTVSVGATRERPTSYPPNVVFFDSDDRAYRMDATNTSEWGNGETMYVLVAVKDTGIGISQDRQKVLFERFRQATPKTSEVYGGTGLGLNISRKLCHLHGGEIGVASKENEGSTFSFFFKVRRTSDPGEEGSQQAHATEDTADVKSHMEKQGLESPTHVDQASIPESVQSPPVRNVFESMSPNRILDERYQETADAAAEVAQPEPDVYAMCERPESAEEHARNELLQPPEIARPQAQLDTVLHTTSLPGPRKIHILLAEDNIVNQRILFRKLQRQGYHVTTANNGQEAMDGVRNAPKLTSGEQAAFDIVLMDQEMPVMDGNAATVGIRKMERHGEVEHLPILGVTANVRDDQQDEMRESGMDDVISKPYKITELVTKMEALLKGMKSAVDYDPAPGG